VNISLFDLKKTLSPKQFAHELSKKGALYWWPPGNFWVVTNYDIAHQLLTGEKVTCDRSPFFISRMPDIDLSLLSDFFDVVSKMMVMRDGDAHQASRRICYHGFANKHIKAITPSIEQTVKKQVGKVAHQPSFDFVSEIATIIPMKTLADFFNIPLSDREEFVAHAKTMTAFFGGASSYQNEDAIRVNAAATALKQYFKDLYLERKRQPKEDFFSQLCLYQDEFGLTQDELISQAIMMWVAGMVTTTDQMCNNFYTLLEQYSDGLCLLQDQDKLTAIIQECNRLDPAVTFTFRLASEDISIDDKTIQQGQTIFISNHAVNRDQMYFEVPDRIDLTRKNNHFSYGMGGHFCLGAKLSLIEMQLVFSHLFKSCPRLRINRYQRLHYSLSFSGFEHLEVSAEYF
jgi:cytochrome P450 PksS